MFVHQLAFQFTEDFSGAYVGFLAGETIYINKSKNTWFDAYHKPDVRKDFPLFGVWAILVFYTLPEKGIFFYEIGIWIGFLLYYDF